MNIAYILIKIITFILIVFFVGDTIMQTISYSFYKGDRQLQNVLYEPTEIQINNHLFGYGCHLEQSSDKIILCFGGSMYIAYNTVGMYAGQFDCPFLAVDYYGTQKSKGKMNLKTMQQSAEELYDFAKKNYPDKDIYIFGHSYGCGMASYLASVRECKHLVLISGYRSSADMYNKFLPIYHGVFQVFIKNNIRTDQYAVNTTCSVTVIGSDTDTTLNAELQEKVAACYPNSELQIFEGVKHEDYLITEEVVRYIQEYILN